MLAKGIIKNIDFVGNTCTVWIPQFETAGNSQDYIVEATFAVNPGVYNGYNINDVVWVGFESNNLGKPVVLGKLYLGIQKEILNEPTGAGSFSTAVIKNQLEIPSNTKINYTPTEISNAEFSYLSNYNSLEDIINAINQISTQLNTFTNSTFDYSEAEQEVGKWPNGKKLYRQTIYFTNTTTLDITLPDNIDLNSDYIFVDPAHSFYFLTEENLRTVRNITEIQINATEQTLSIATIPDNASGYLTICYTRS